MKIKALLLIFLFPFFSLADDLKLVKIKKIRPTQIVFGSHEVRQRRKKIRKLDEKDLDKYLKKRYAPAILAPDGYYYIIDRHHLSMALIKEDRCCVYIKQIAEKEFSNITTMSAFWAKMKELGYVWLYDENGAEIKPKDLPSRIEDMRDDPFRSLAGEIEEEGLFEKEIPFAENIWARFFRSRISKETLEDNWDLAMTMAARLAESPAVKNLPGALTCDRALKLLF